MPPPLPVGGGGGRVCSVPAGWVDGWVGFLVPPSSVPPHLGACKNKSLWAPSASAISTTDRSCRYSSMSSPPSARSTRSRGMYVRGVRCRCAEYIASKHSRGILQPRPNSCFLSSSEGRARPPPLCSWSCRWRARRARGDKDRSWDRRPQP